MQVLEVRPVIDWNKGKAVGFLLDSLGLADSDNVLPIYIGDDLRTAQTRMLGTKIL